MSFQLFFMLILISTITSKEEDKECRYRDHVMYPYEVFHLVTGFWCYRYSNPAWFIKNNPFRANQSLYPYNNKNYIVPYIFNQTDQTVAVYLDNSDNKTKEIVKTLFKEAKFYNKWEMCTKAADECCLYHLNEDNSMSTKEYSCPALWDGYTCFPQTSAYTTVFSRCPLYTTSEDKFVCNLQSEKYCLHTGWINETNYLVCASSFTYKTRHNFHIIVLYVAVAIMFPSVIIFLVIFLLFPKSKELNIDKLVFHRNLIFAILIKNILVIISKNIVILDSLSKESNHVMLNNGVPCRILAYLESVSKNLIFTCMCADALYLHKLVARPFKSEPNMLIVYALITVFSFTPTTIWMILMVVNDKQNCWMSDTDSWFQWISDGYKFAMLGINLLLLLDICRVFCSKAGGNKQKSKIDRKSAIKATLILFPLFGIPMLVTGQRGLVDSDDCLASNIFFYVTYILEGGQGVFMACYFCYFNSDVQKCLKVCYNKLKSKLGLETHRRRTSARRTTTITVS